MNKTAIIMIGVPGSGKSTKAGQLLRERLEVPGTSGVIHSTDSYFVDASGVYNFDVKKLGYFHTLNVKAYEASIDKGIDLVICDNTNVRARDRKPYIEYAKKKGYSVVIEVVGNFETKDDLKLYAARNTHGVPYASIEKMWETYRANRIS